MVSGGGIMRCLKSWTSTVPPPVSAVGLMALLRWRLQEMTPVVEELRRLREAVASMAAGSVPSAATGVNSGAAAPPGHGGPDPPKKKCALTCP